MDPPQHDEEDHQGQHPVEDGQLQQQEAAARVNINRVDFAPQGFEAQALAQVVPEWSQPGHRISLTQQQLVDYILNNVKNHTNLVMQLSEDERQQARAIKAAVQEDDELEEVPDMRYAQLALIDGDDVDRALERIRHFQLFKYEYQLEDSFDEGNRIMRSFFEKQPGAVLSVSYNAIDGNYVYIYDQVAFNPHSIQTPEDWRVALFFCYYVFQAMTPDVFAIRQGCVFIGECDGYDWTMVNVDCVRRLWDEVFSVYPIKIGELKCFHSGVVANILLSMLKPFFPRDLQHRINLGCQFEGRLDTYYAVPTWEAAAQKTLKEIESFLCRRYYNESQFVL